MDDCTTSTVTTGTTTDTVNVGEKLKITAGYLSSTKIIEAAGGGAKFASDVMTVPANTNYTVTLGFKPKYLVIFRVGSNSTDAAPTADLVHIYDERVSTATVYYYSQKDANQMQVLNYTIPIESGTTAFRIRKIEDNGFIYRGTSSQRYYKYIAIG